MKKETLEEVAENFWLNDDSMTDNDRISYVNGFLACAKWQQQNSYSDEEVLDILFKHTEYFNGYGKRMTLTEWFNKFKKK